MAGTEVVQVVREPKRDGFGNLPPGGALTWQVPGWLFAPGPSKELGAGTNTVESDGTLYGELPVTEISKVVPGGIRPSDRIRVRGDLYSVVGRVHDWGTDGTVIVLKRVTG